MIYISKIAVLTITKYRAKCFLNAIIKSNACSYVSLTCMQEFTHTTGTFKSLHDKLRKRMTGLENRTKHSLDQY